MEGIEAYRILWAGSPRDLETAVAEWMKLGWKPYGGVAVSGSGILYQAMVSFDANTATLFRFGDDPDLARRR